MSSESQILFKIGRPDMPDSMFLVTYLLITAKKENGSREHWCADTGCRLPEKEINLN